MISHERDNFMKKPILVTGSPRSGSTWVGQMLASSARVAYLHEPFNPDNYRRGRCKAHFKNRFYYVCDENKERYKDPIDSLLRYKYQWVTEISYIKSARDIGRLLRDSSLYAMYRFLNARPLIKDPIAIFSAEWLAREFNMDVVIMIRHPAAFAASIKRKNQPFRFAEILDQPLLMRDYLAPFAHEMEAMREGGRDRIDEAILLWRMIYTQVQRYQKKYPDWIFIRHEDLSQDPLHRFRDLYEKLNLSYTNSAEKALRFHTSGSREKIIGGNNISMDSVANIRSWKKRLTIEEIERVKMGTEDVCSHFYSEEDWFGDE